MNKLNKLLCAATISAMSTVANANPIYMDLTDLGVDNTLLGGVSMTEVFDNFITTSFNPTSTYVDTNGVAGIQTGDYVFDEAIDIPLSSLQPLNVLASAGYGLTWQLNVDWVLEGVTVVVPDAADPGVTNYVGFFNTGVITFDFEDLLNPGNNQQDILTLSVSSTSGTVPTNSELALSVFAELTGVKDNTFFTNNGTDFHDILNDGDPTTNLDFKGTTNLSQINNAPTATGGTLNIGGTDYDVYERSTRLGSVDIRTVSEPSTLFVLGLALVGFAASSRKKMAK